MSYKEKSKFSINSQNISDGVGDEVAGAMPPILSVDRTAVSVTTTTPAPTTKKLKKKQAQSKSVREEIHGSS